MVQTPHEFFRLAMCFSGRTRNVGSNYVGRQGNSDRDADGQVSRSRWGSPHTGAKIAFDVGIVEPNSNSLSERSGCNQSPLKRERSLCDRGCRLGERNRQEAPGSLQSAWAHICANHLHESRPAGDGRGIPATDLAPTLEEG